MMTITMKLIILYSDGLNPIAPFASLLHLSPLQKHKFISTSTDCFPQIICTAWSSRLHCASWANVALAQPRNKGTVDINIQGYLYLRLLLQTCNYTKIVLLLRNITLIVISCFCPETTSHTRWARSDPFVIKPHLLSNVTSMVVHLCILSNNTLSSAISVYQSILFWGNLFQTTGITTYLAIWRRWGCCIFICIFSNTRRNINC